MTEVIINTNVLVVANGQNSDVIESCEDACIRFLVQASATGVVLMDRLGEILEEYIRAVNRDRPHGFGARFLFQLIQQQPDRARLEDLDKKEDGEFVDFPHVPELAAFDRSDRKFAALARKTGTAVTNATDSDWADNLPALQANGIAVDFLCGCDKTKWFRN